MTEIPKPSKEEVDKYIEKWKTLETNSRMDLK